MHKKKDGKSNKLSEMWSTFFSKLRNIFFFFVLKCKQKEHVPNLNRRWAQSALKA